MEDPRQIAAFRALNISDDSIDGAVRDLCERFGYGAVMDSASRQWIKKDSVGAYYIGGCLAARNLDRAVKGDFD